MLVTKKNLNLDTNSLLTYLRGQQASGQKL